MGKKSTYTDVQIRTLAEDVIRKGRVGGREGVTMLIEVLDDPVMKQKYNTAAGEITASVAREAAERDAKKKFIELHIEPEPYGKYIIFKGFGRRKDLKIGEGKLSDIEAVVKEVGFDGLHALFAQDEESTVYPFITANES